MQSPETVRDRSHPDTTPAPRRASLETLWERAAPVLFVLPSLIAILIFVYGFIGWTGYTSLTKWDTLNPDFTFVGLENYAKLFRDFRFQSDLRNTLFFTLFFLAGCLVLGIVSAVLIDQKVKGEGFFRSVYLFPMALSFVVTGTVWQWLFNPSTGVNVLPEALGLDPLNFRWYTDPAVWPSTIKVGLIKFGIPVALLPVVIAAVWQLSGFTMAMYLAGLRGIPDEIREAARVDGATEFQVYRHVIFPQLWPITLSAVIILGHISLKIFDLIFTMTGSGPAFATDVPGVFMFETTFRGNHFAQGAAIAMIMLLMVAVVIVPYLMNTNVEENAT